VIQAQPAAQPTNQQPYQQPAQQPYQQPYQQPAQQPYQRPNYNIPAEPAKPNAVVIYFKILWECFKAYFKDASTTLKLSASHNDIKTGLSFAGVNCVLVGLFLIATMNTLYKAIMSTVSGVAGAFGVSSDVTGPVASSIKFPYFELFLLAFVFAAAAYFAICVIGMLFGAITGKKASFKAFMAAVGTSSLPSAVVMILATIFASFWLQGAMTLMVIALITWLISTYAAIKAALDITDGKISIYYGLFSVIVLGIIFLIASRIAPSVLGQITIEGQKLSSLFSSLSNLSNS
jgi:hypothetical protein